MNECLNCKQNREGQTYEFYYAHSYATGGTYSYMHTYGYDALGYGSGFICNICAHRERLIVALRNIIFLIGYIVLICLFLRYYGKIDLNFFRLLEAYIVLSISLLFLQYRLKNFHAYAVLFLQPVVAIIVYISLFFPVMLDLSFLFGLFLGIGWLIAGGFLVLAKLMTSGEYIENKKDNDEKHGRELVFRCSYAEIIKKESELFYFQNLECWSIREYQSRTKS